MKLWNMIFLNKISIILFMSIVTAMFVASLFLNYVGSKSIVNGNIRSIASVSYKYFTLITPARITFSIWGIIYSLATIVLSLWWVQIFNADRETIQSFRSIIFLFFLISMINPLWIFFWVRENITLSLVTMTILFSLLLLSNILSYQIDNRYAKWVQIFFDTYMAWISLAFSINIAVFLIVSQIPIFNSYPLFWAICVLSFILILASYMIIVENRLTYSLVILWAFIGIYLQNDPRVEPYPILKTISLIYIMLLIGVFITKLMYSWKEGV